MGEWRNRPAEKRKLYNSRKLEFMRQFPDIYRIWNHNKYINKIYKLATMPPCKRVIWRLEQLMENLENCSDMVELDKEYWALIKPKIEECLMIASSWRKAEMRLNLHNTTPSKKLRVIEGL